MWCFTYSGMREQYDEFIFMYIWVDFYTVCSNYMRNSTRYILLAEPVPLLFNDLWSSALFITPEPDLSFHWALPGGRSNDGRGIYKESVLTCCKISIKWLLQPFWNKNWICYHIVTSGMPSWSKALSTGAMWVSSEQAERTTWAGVSGPGHAEQALMGLTWPWFGSTGPRK